MDIPSRREEDGAAAEGEDIDIGSEKGGDDGDEVEEASVDEGDDPEGEDEEAEEEGGEEDEEDEEDEGEEDGLEDAGEDEGSTTGSGSGEEEQEEGEGSSSEGSSEDDEDDAGSESGSESGNEEGGEEGDSVQEEEDGTAAAAACLQDMGPEPALLPVSSPLPAPPGLGLGLPGTAPEPTAVTPAAPASLGTYIPVSVVGGAAAQPTAPPASARPALNITRVYVFHDGENCAFRRDEAYNIVVLRNALQHLALGGPLPPGTAPPFFKWEFILGSLASKGAEEYTPSDGLKNALVTAGANFIDAGTKAGGVDVKLKDMVRQYIEEQAGDGLADVRAKTCVLIVSSDRDFASEVRALLRAGVRVGIVCTRSKVAEAYAQEANFRGSWDALLAASRLARKVQPTASKQPKTEQRSEPKKGKAEPRLKRATGGAGGGERGSERGPPGDVDFAKAVRKALRAQPDCKLLLTQLGSSVRLPPSAAAAGQKYAQFLSTAVPGVHVVVLGEGKDYVELVHKVRGEKKQKLRSERAKGGGASSGGRAEHKSSSSTGAEKKVRGEKTAQGKDKGTAKAGGPRGVDKKQKAPAKKRAEGDAAASAASKAPSSDRQKGEKRGASTATAGKGRGSEPGAAHGATTAKPTAPSKPAAAEGSAPRNKAQAAAAKQKKPSPPARGGGKK